jgi:hypothetical protein
MRIYHTPCDMRTQHATCDVQHASCNVQHHAERIAQHGAGDAMQRIIDGTDGTQARQAQLGPLGSSASPVRQVGLSGPIPPAPLHHPLLVSRVLRVPSWRLFCVLLGDASFPSRLPRAASALVRRQ